MFHVRTERLRGKELNTRESSLQDSGGEWCGCTSDLLPSPALICDHGETGLPNLHPKSISNGPAGKLNEFLMCMQVYFLGV